MKLKKYLTLTRAGIIEALQFRLSFVVMVIGNMLYLIVVYFLWKAIYASMPHRRSSLLGQTALMDAFRSLPRNLHA